MRSSGGVGDFRRAARRPSVKWQAIAVVAAIAIALPPLSAVAQGLPASTEASPFAPAEGPVTIAEGLVKKGDLVVSYPVQARYTGVLVGDAKVGSKVFLPDGSPVYRASFVETLNGTGIAGGTVWCGVPPGADKGWCILDVGHGLDVLVGMSTLFHPTPWSPDSYSTLSEHLSKPYPTVREQPVTFPVKLRQEITFGAWTHDAARFGVRIFDDAGRKSFWTSLTAPREADGSVVFPLRDGALRLRQAGNSLTVEQVSPTKPAP